jgi:hypothetical protein
MPGALAPNAKHQVSSLRTLRFLGYLLLKLFSKISTQIEQKETKFLSISVESIRALSRQGMITI